MRITFRVLEEDEKAGFAFAGLIETVDGPERLMACRRPEPTH